MQVKAISWMGVKTEKFDELTRFFREVLNLPVMSEERDFVVFQLPNKDQVEVFGPSGPNQHFVPDSPVCGFLVDDIEQARNELIQAGIELIGPLRRVPNGYAWQHFRGPNGTMYELPSDPEGR
jgi:predicted enzyme related to lactoylglutathione lyase